ncbi:hypothetical protein [Piscinibacter koreensis]|uniref:hypothetical protein n=1 Tax=Piscinibacter koreensis TaxID=2742824 RepID=UPI003CC9205C
MAAKHVGHHEHRHSPSGEPDGSSEKRAGGVLEDVDGDCGYCHLHCAQALVSPLELSLGHAAHPVVSRVFARYTTRAPDELDRPNWRRLARLASLEEPRIR